MSIATIRPLLSQVRYPVSSSLSIPPLCYHDEEWFLHEQNCLFRQGWLGIGRRDQWREAGDYQAINVAGVLVVIVLDKDGSLSALSNTCLHRASQIMSGQGQ